MDNGSLSRG